MDEAAAQNRPLLWACKKYCPKLVVYLPKFVTVQNPKLGLLNLIFTLFCVLTIVYYFWTNTNHMVKKEPEITLSICGPRCLKTDAELDKSVAGALNEAYCQNPNWDVMYQDHHYESIKCVGRCGSGLGSSESCMLKQEQEEVASGELFFPTFYQETFYTSPHWTGLCPLGLNHRTENPGPNQTIFCEKHGNYFVAGAENNRMILNHEFSITPLATMLDSLIPPKVLSAHSGSFRSNGWDIGMVTILFNAKGEEQARFEQSNSVNLTLGELLRAAAYEPESEQAELDLDTGYEPAELGFQSWVPIRLSGTQLTVDVFTTKEGKCPMYHFYSDVVKEITVPSDGPVTCITVFANRRWVMKESTLPVGSGGYRNRRTHGIVVNFRKMGSFAFFDTKAMFNNITVIFVWMTIPLMMTTSFSVMLLGKLSKVYSRVLYPELNLKEACKGLMARLMHHSAAYTDLKDSDKGISKTRIHDRFKDFLMDNEDIDEDELNRFVEFVFDGLKGTGHHPSSDKHYVSMQEFVEVCASNEPLNFQALVQLFDKDRKQTCLESFFLDPSLREVLQAADEEVVKPEPIDFTKVSEGAGLTSNHSRVETAEVEVEDMLKALKNMEQKAFKTAGELEIGEEVLGFRSFETASTNVDPKLDQRESFCSIADEEDECAGGGAEGTPEQS
uniref:Uncharacterized protein n=1 Tax=Alexandrium monilatum TaxID=311494 RepID=A0A7S4QJW9_9DINO|mmetsp:Transcript_109141/g.336925  ORF Transcript_109141/g.336925 Transcript_109141/m.336925 type:complete len:671 (-) Transcript_109141:41-2053(-)